MKNYIISLFFVLLFCLTVFSSCETTLDKVDRFEATYNILENGSAETTIVIVANYPQECLIEKWKQAVDFNSKDAEVIEISSTDLICPKEFLLNNFKRELGDFPNPLSCTTIYASDKNHIKMTFSGISIPTSSISDNNKEKTIYLGSDSIGSSLPSDSSLSITIPSSSTIISHSPTEGEKLVNKIVWNPFPKSTVSIAYSLPVVVNNSNDSYLALIPNLFIAIIIVAILIGISIVILLFRSKKEVVVQKAPSVDKKAQVQDLKAKIANLEKSYLLGKMDENTYQRLTEQYQLQLNDLITEIRKEEGK